MTKGYAVYLMKKGAILRKKIRAPKVHEAELDGFRKRRPEQPSNAEEHNIEIPGEQLSEHWRHSENTNLGRPRRTPVGGRPLFERERDVNAGTNYSNTEDQTIMEEDKEESSFN